MGAKKRDAQMAAGARRKDEAKPASAAAVPANEGRKKILTTIGTVALVALLGVIVYFKFVHKPYVKPLEPSPLERERKDWQSLIDGERAMASIKRLLDLGPRVAGTEGSIRAQQMIKAELGAAGISDIREQKFTDKTPKGDGNFANLIGVLPGKRPEGIALAAHYDSKLFEDFYFVGANDAASAVGVLFELARKLKAMPDREITYYFLFFDGEEAFLFDWNQWESETEQIDNTYGSRYFVRKMDDENYPIKALVLLDLVGDIDYSLANSEDFSKELVGIFKKASVETFGVDFFVQQHAHLGDDHEPFVKKGIPAIDLIDFEYGRGGSREYWHTPLDTIDKLSVRSLERTGTLVLKALPEVEKMVLKGLSVGTTSR
jgi:glutaminyl-peptide cyclotransferase